MRRIILFGSTLLVAVTALPSSAQQSTIDFSEYASPTTTEYQATVGNAVTSKGIEVAHTSLYWANATNALGTWGSSAADPGNINRPTNIGSATTLFSTSTAASGVDFWGVGANPVTNSWVAFDLFSIDLAHAFHPSYIGLTALPAVTVTFAGFGAAGNFASQMFTIAAGLTAPTLQTFTLGWTNAYNIWFTVNSFAPDAGRAVQFTNLVTTWQEPTEVPEPLSMALLGTGILGVAAARRRRKAEKQDA
jgi:hypothetical protein